MMTPFKYIHELLGIDTFHNGGIKGNGSVVGITDSGLDMAHDQFKQSQSVYNQFNLKARKVVYYETYADAKDQSDQNDRTCGHGTHVCGILAGNSIDSDALGVAPDAQIAFLDIAKDCTLSTCASPIALTIPRTTDALFQNQTKAGAKIISYSWGTMSNSGLLASASLDYDDQTRAIDEYLYNNPEVLLIVAAGNGGANGAKTILSPAGAKNVLTVGASIADAKTLAFYANDTQPSDCQDIINEDALTLYSSLGPTSDGRLKPDLVVP
ncbi:serine protease family S08A, partial [Thraustotheca clavata]